MRTSIASSTGQSQMNAQVIPLIKASAHYAARLFSFDESPTADTLLERARIAESLYTTAASAHNHRPSWTSPPAGLEALRQTSKFFWERCVDSDIAVETVFAALERSGADEAAKDRVRSHFSAFCHSF